MWELQLPHPEKGHLPSFPATLFKNLGPVNLSPALFEN